MSIKEALKETATAAPAATNLTLSVFGVPLQSWVLILSAVLILCQLFWLFYNNLVRKHDGHEEGTDGSGAGN
jgi:hypothetical protein